MQGWNENSFARKTIQPALHQKQDKSLTSYCKMKNTIGGFLCQLYTYFIKESFIL